MYPIVGTAFIVIFVIIGIIILIEQWKGIRREKKDKGGKDES